MEETETALLALGNLRFRVTRRDGDRNSLQIATGTTGERYEIVRIEDGQPWLICHVSASGARDYKTVVIDGRRGNLATMYVPSAICACLWHSQKMQWDTFELAKAPNGYAATREVAERIHQAMYEEIRNEPQPVGRSTVMWEAANGRI